MVPANPIAIATGKPIAKQPVTLVISGIHIKLALPNHEQLFVSDVAKIQPDPIKSSTPTPNV